MDLREEDLEVTIKVVVVGNGAVGKSSMIQRYCKGIFTKDYKKTIGVDFLEKLIKVKNEDVRLMLWDTAGQEEFDAITKAYYRVDRESFQVVEKWRTKVLNECGDIPMVLVQNKIDLIDQARVTSDEAENLARHLRLRFYRTSVKENLNVSEVFHYLTERYMEKLNNTTDTPASPTQSIGGGAKQDNRKGRTAQERGGDTNIVTLRANKRKGNNKQTKGGGGCLVL